MEKSSEEYECMYNIQNIYNIQDFKEILLGALALQLLVQTAGIIVHLQCWVYVRFSVKIGVRHVVSLMKLIDS